MPTNDENARRIPATAILAYMTDALRAVRLPDADAKTVAGAMLDADLSGSDAHGIFRLAGYVRQLKGGIFNPRANIKVLERSPATALVDGDNGMGHLVMTYAANLAVEIARESGVGWVGSAAPTIRAPARPMRRFRWRTAWSEYTAPCRRRTSWRPGAAPSYCSGPIRSPSEFPPATNRRSCSTSLRRSCPTGRSAPMPIRAGHCRRDG